jgi:ElaB/YqjD/DUF883 family membrane-anchored ribosome-binding protein
MEHDGNKMMNDPAAALREGRRQIEERMEGVREYAGDFDQWVRAFARDRPIMAICCAAGLGFIIGRIASKT